jgi:hypothetical protein
VRLVDAVFRQGHLSEQALVEAVMTGERPAHLDRCDICAERSVELGRWLDDVRNLGLDAAERAFPAEKLVAQQSQIMRKLEQLDEPSRVIAFPRQMPAAAREAGGRRVAPAWLGVAAAAGLLIGVIGGHFTAQVSATAHPAQAAVAPAVVATPATQPATPAPAASTPATVTASLIDLDLDNVTPRDLATLNDYTPTLVSARARSIR